MCISSSDRLILRKSFLIHFLNRSPLYRSALYQEDFSVTLLELGLSSESIKANIEPEHILLFTSWNQIMDACTIMQTEDEIRSIFEDI